MSAKCAARAAPGMLEGDSTSSVKVASAVAGDSSGGKDCIDQGGMGSAQALHFAPALGARLSTGLS